MHAEAGQSQLCDVPVATERPCRQQFNEAWYSVARQSLVPEQQALAMSEIRSRPGVASALQHGCPCAA